MLAAVLVDVGRIELRDIPVVAPGRHDVRVRVTAVGLCGTDFHIFGGHANYHTDGRGRPVPLAEHPQILGHEVAAIVAEVGAGVVDLRPLLAQGGMFTWLQEPRNFLDLEVEEYGHAVSWTDDNGREIDLSSDSLRRDAEKQAALHLLAS